MLAQSFKSAADLGITEPQLSALQKTLVLLETGKLKHVPMGTGVAEGGPFSGQFNMNQWSAYNECGTIACIGGTAALIGGFSSDDFDLCHNSGLDNLFYPRQTPYSVWAEITEAQAATALRSYLTTGDANWSEAVR